MPLVTDRQRAIYELLAQGHTKAEVGARLFITEDTVKTQMLRTHARIGARNRVHAVALLMAAGEIALPVAAELQQAAGEPHHKDHQDHDNKRSLDTHRDSWSSTGTG